MPATRGKFSSLLAPGLMTVFFRYLKIHMNEFEQWINVKKSKRAYEDDYEVAGLGQMIQKGEGAPFTFDEPIGGSTRRYTHLTYGLGFRVTQEMMEDDLYGVMNRMTEELAKSAKYNKDVQAASVLNNAFNSSFTGLDGLELCSTVHTNLGGGTQANEPSTAADLALTSLQAAIETFEGWTDSRGFKIDTSPEWLIHNTGDIWEAGELLESEFIPTSADNAKNIVRSKYGIKPKYLKHLSDADAWFLVGSKSDHDMKMFLRVNDQFRNDDDPYNGDALMTARHRLSTGFSRWENVYGSPGA